MPISTSSLFHFTDSLDSLVSILTHEFRPRLSFEDPSFMFPDGLDWAVAVPMVSFCDIPLSQVVQHMSTYGSFGIGLTKEWGIRNGVAPVLYAHAHAPFAKSLQSLILLRIAKKRPIRSSKSRITDAASTPVEIPVSDKAKLLVRLLNHVKPFRGDFYRRGNLVPNVSFYDEREWRWVPADAGSYPAVTREQYLDASERKAANAAIWEHGRLTFEPSDIRYLIVATDAEILPLIQAVETIKGKYSHNEVRILCSRIVSADQIRADF